MRIFRSLRWAQQSAREYMGWVWYLKPQRYRVEYCVELKNTSVGAQTVTLVIPVPEESAVQMIHGAIQYSPTPPTVRTEELYGNTLAVWTHTIQPGSTVTVRQQYTMTVMPVVVSMRQVFSMNDYEHLRREDVNRYCASNRFIMTDDPTIQELARTIRGNQDDVLTILDSLNRYVIDHLDYGDPIPGLYSAREALERPRVDCGGYDTLLASLASALGIPARIVSGFWAGYTTNDMHAWVEFMLPDGHWIPADPSVEYLYGKGRTRKSAKLGTIGSDRITLSYGCDIPIALDTGAVTADIVQHPIVIPASPIESRLTFTAALV